MKLIGRLIIFFIFFGILNLAEAIESVEIKNGKIKFLISRATGEIEEGWNQIAHERYFKGIAYKYELENEDECITIQENGDKVLDYTSNTDSNGNTGLTFNCINEGLGKYGISIIKRYRLDENQLYKEISFKNEGNKGFFVRLFDNTILEPELRDNSYYYAPTRGRTFLASQIMSNTPVYDPDIIYLVAVVVNTTKGYGVAGYPYRVNGKYTGCISIAEDIKPENTLIYTSTGWESYLGTDYIRKNGISSFEIKYTIFKGDSSSFLHEYRTSSEIINLTKDYNFASWINKVKLVMFSCPAQDIFLNDDAIEKFNEITNRLGEGYIMPIFNFWTGSGGNYYTAGKEVEWMKTKIDAIHKTSPQVKLGIYVLLQGIEPYVPLVNEHPEWLIKDRKGQYDSRITYGPAIQPAIPEMREYAANQMTKAIQTLDFDFYNVDWGISAFWSPKFHDWGNHIVSQWYYYYLFYKEIIDAVKKNGDKAFLFNSAPTGILTDAAFDEWGIDGYYSKHPNNDWRNLSDQYYCSKLFQEKGSWVALLYWHKGTEPLYVSYLLALGLKPNYFPVSDEEFAFLDVRIPYINAAYEIKDTMLIDADISPWWRKEETDVDAYALKQGDTCILSAINFAKTPLVQTISANVQKLGLDSSKPAFLWIGEMADPRNLTTRLNQVIEHTKFDILENLDKRIEEKVTLNPELVKLIIISQTPGFVYSVDGRLTQMRLSNISGVDIKGNINFRENEIELEVNSEKEICEVIVPYPFKTGEPKVVLDGNEMPYRETNEAGERFLIIELQRGISKLKITSGPFKLHLPQEKLILSQKPIELMKSNITFVPQGSVKIINDKIEFYIGASGCYDYDSGYGTSLKYKDVRLHKTLFYLHYTDNSGRKKAGFQRAGHRAGIAMDNIIILTPTQKINDESALTRLATDDKKITIEVNTKMGYNKTACQTFNIINNSNEFLRDIRFSYFCWFGVGGWAQQRGEFEPANNSVFFYEPTVGIYAGFSSSNKADSYGVGNWPVAHNYMVLEIEGKGEYEGVSASGFMSWQLGDLKNGETATLPVFLGIGDTRDDLAAQLNGGKDGS